MIATAAFGLIAVCRRKERQTASKIIKDIKI
jgi:hypothetical protein